MTNEQHPKGKVILAGAGCGDPELITMKVVRYLQQADVVLADRLVSEEILTNYVKTGATIILVGKQHDTTSSTPQAVINDLIVAYALQNKLVVRLKGGDVAFYSNVLDELQTLVAHNIPYEIVPGITAAAGAAAYAGIPLTARGFSTAVRFLAHHKKDILPESYWSLLAHTDDTLIFYMSSAGLCTIVENLVHHHIDAGKLLAVVEQATTPSQKISICSLYDYDTVLKGRTLASPSILIIGKVVALHHKFGWLQNSESENLYFKALQ